MAVWESHLSKGLVRFSKFNFLQQVIVFVGSVKLRNNTGTGLVIQLSNEYPQQDFLSKQKNSSWGVALVAVYSKDLSACNTSYNTDYCLLIASPRDCSVNHIDRQIMPTYPSNLSITRWMTSVAVTGGDSFTGKIIFDLS